MARKRETNQQVSERMAEKIQQQKYGASPFSGGSFTRSFLKCSECHQWINPDTDGRGDVLDYNSDGSLHTH